MPHVSFSSFKKNIGRYQGNGIVYSSIEHDPNMDIFLVVIHDMQRHIEHIIT